MLKAEAKEEVNRAPDSKEQVEVERLRREVEQLRMERDILEAPDNLSISTAPKYTLRGHQLGYRPKTNSYDGWNVARRLRSITTTHDDRMKFAIEDGGDHGAGNNASGRHTDDDLRIVGA